MLKLQYPGILHALSKLPRSKYGNAGSLVSNWSAVFPTDGLIIFGAHRRCLHFVLIAIRNCWLRFVICLEPYLRLTWVKLAQKAHIQSSASVHDIAATGMTRSG